MSEAATGIQNAGGDTGKVGPNGGDTGSASVKAITPNHPEGVSNGNAGPTWYDAFPDETKGYVQTKGWQDPASVVESYRNLEKLKGAPADRLIKLPENISDNEAMKDVYSRLGKPVSAEEYELIVPEGGNEDFAKWAKNTFHEINLTRAQAKAFSDKWNEYVASRTAEMDRVEAEQYEQKTNQEDLQLKQEWGLAYDKNLGVARQGATKFGVDAAKIDQLEKAWGYKETMKFLHAVGSGTGEHSYVAGEGAGGKGPITPEQAKYELSELKKDKEFQKRWVSGDKEARDRLNYLNQMIVGVVPPR